MLSKNTNDVARICLYLTPMEASNNYALRDGLEKCHRHMKSTQGMQQAEQLGGREQDRTSAHSHCQSDTQLIHEIHLEVDPA